MYVNLCLTDAGQQVIGVENGFVLVWTSVSNFQMEIRRNSDIHYVLVYVINMFDKHKKFVSDIHSPLKSRRRKVDLISREAFQENRFLATNYLNFTNTVISCVRLLRYCAQLGSLLNLNDVSLISFLFGLLKCIFRISNRYDFGN